MSRINLLHSTEEGGGGMVASDVLCRIKPYSIFTVGTRNY